MLRLVGGVVGVLLLVVAVLFEPLIKPAMRDMGKTPRDPVLGTIDEMTPAQLATAYAGKRVLLVGGTRGVGRGTALAVAAAGAHVTVVGRSEASGTKVLQELRAAAPPGSAASFTFLQGDLGSARSSAKLLNVLQEDAATNGKYDYFVQTAAVFPDWANGLQQEDGLEKGFAIAVIGRYTLYKHADTFMHKGGRVLNVLASGNEPFLGYDRALAVGERNVTGLIEAIMTWCMSAEMMLIGLGRHHERHGLTYVTTHPGLLATDLHDHQGWLMDLLEPIAVAVMGISEERCGLRQASILASPRLHEGGLAYVDEYMIGRRAGAKIEAMADEHIPWLWEFMNRKVAGALAA